MALTDRVVKSIRGTGKPQKLIDGSGLYLRVTPNGTKTWWYRRQGDGNDRWKRLGRYPAMSLLEARNQASDAAGRGSLMRTVRQAWGEYLPTLRRAYKSHAEIERRLENDFVDVLGKRQLDRVTKADCADAMQAIVKRGSPVAANRTLADLKHFLDYCTDRGWIQGSPAAGIKRRSVGGTEESRERALTFAELEAFIVWLMHHRYERSHLASRFALALILITGQRPSEVLGFHQREMHGCWWHIPGERTKNGKLQKVYICPQARWLFTRSLQILGKQPFHRDHRVLSRLVSRACSANSWAPFTPHDLRRTMSTRLADLGVAPHVVEKMLNHRMEGAMAVYNRAEYLPERRAAWRLWGCTLAAIRRATRANNDPASSPGRLRRGSSAVQRAQQTTGVQPAMLKPNLLLPAGGQALRKRI